MPPKTGPSKKTVNKEKQKIIEDKTFGLKNKNKSKKLQQYVEQVKTQVMQGNARKTHRAEPTREDIRKEEELRQAELAVLFKPVQVQQKVVAGVDPKSVVCAFFKVNQCTKGDRCKFSHNLAVERKSEKIDLYSDVREDKEKDTMDQWDQSKLEEVVAKKHGAANRTEIVCKYFIEAIEKSQYGWFWECPNGGMKCMYRHALPPGFVLKKNVKKEETDEQITIEEFLETERHKLGSNLTPITFESFMKWKQTQKERKDKEALELSKKKEADVRAGRAGLVTGRDLFTYQPDLFVAGDEEGAMDADAYATREADADEAPEKDTFFEPSAEEAGADIDEDLFEDVENIDLNEDEEQSENESGEEEENGGEEDGVASSEEE